MTLTLKTGTCRTTGRNAVGVLATLAAVFVCAVEGKAQDVFSGTANLWSGTATAGTAGAATVAGNLPDLMRPGTSAGQLPGHGVPASDASDQNELSSAQPTVAVVPSGDDDVDQIADSGLDQPLDPGVDAIDQQGAPRKADDPTGIRIGTFMLRPSVSQSIATERTRGAGINENRDFLATGIRGVLSSDWSRHALTITGNGRFERNISGSQNGTEPEANVSADLRLDLADETVAHLTAGYDFEREDVTDPNALGSAAEQAGIHRFDGGTSVERDLGRIHGLAAVEASRYLHTDAELSDGTVVSMKDRNRTTIDGRLRLGYELSPALVPFAEVALGHTFYDRKRDSSGYQRSSDNYAGRVGVEFDLGEKLRGELSSGYEHVAYEDARLKDIDAFIVDGNIVWSPRRGTDVDLGLRTTVEDATGAGQSGWVEYQLASVLTHELRNNLVARLTAETTLRDFQDGGGNNVTWLAGAGLTWNINRHVDMTGDVEYERTTGGGADQDILRAGVGLTLKR
jgi:hypothetical protein